MVKWSPEKRKGQHSKREDTLLLKAVDLVKEKGDKKKKRGGNSTGRKLTQGGQLTVYFVPVILYVGRGRGKKNVGLLIKKTGLKITWHAQWCSDRESETNRGDGKKQRGGTSEL